VIDEIDEQASMAVVERRLKDAQPTRAARAWRALARF